MNKLAILALVSVSASCAGFKAEVRDFKDGAVTCLKEARPAAQALAESILVRALADALSGKSAEEVFDQAREDAEAGAVAQGIPVAACALDDVIAELSAFLHPERASLMARGQSDPLGDGERVLAEFNAAHGVTSVRR